MCATNGQVSQNDLALYYSQSNKPEKETTEAVYSYFYFRKLRNAAKL